MVSALMDTVDRMQLGPTSAAFLEARIRKAGQMDSAIPRAQLQVREDVTGARCKVEPGSLGREIDQNVKPEAGYRGPLYHRPFQRADHPGSPREFPDVDMESAESSNGKYDPDDLMFPSTSVRATVATATAGEAPTVIPHIRVSASPDLNEFDERDHDEDRARR
ncbi:unnamed protein product [Peronospora effusa]|nr:unnamed protein product [Peronospora effusa]